MSLALLFLYLTLNMFRMLIHPSISSLRLICWVISWVVLIWFDVCWYYVVVWLWWCGIRMHQHISNQINTTHEITQQISHKLLRMDILTSETCWALNKEIIKQVTSSWSLFTQLSRNVWLQSKCSFRHFEIMQRGVEEGWQ